MSTTETISTEQIITAAQTMPLSDLQKLVDDILFVRARRVAPHLSGEESKLLRVIQKTLPDKDLKRMKQLQSLRDAEKLDSKGFAELAEIIEKLEKLHADRLNAIIALANLRGVTFQMAMQQLGLKFPDYE